MAHRMELAPNCLVPLAARVQSPERGVLRAFDPVDDEEVLTAEAVPDGEAALSPCQLDLLALDQTPLDSADGATDDVLWVDASLKDPLGRDISIQSRGAAAPVSEVQRFGGVCLNGFATASLPDVGVPVWYVRPLLAWGSFDIRVDGQLTDSGLLGCVDLSHYPTAPDPVLSLVLHPWRLRDDGRLRATPVVAAETMGMAGFRLTWLGATYRQAPVVKVRVERGDSLEGIAQQMCVDPGDLERANAHIEDPRRLPRGETLRVPLLVQASNPPPVKVHRSIALSWREIVRGWTTLN